MKHPPYQILEAAESVASTREFQSQTKAKLGPRNKTSPAEKETTESRSEKHMRTVNEVKKCHSFGLIKDIAASNIQDIVHIG